MEKTMKYFSNNPWKIEEMRFCKKYLGKYEAIFSLGNGYMGLRSATEEKYLGEKRNTFVAGTFNKATTEEITELPNVPDLIQMTIRIDDVELDLTQGETSHYSRCLNFKSGELTRKFVWTYEDLKLEFEFRRFVSFERLHVLGQQIKIKNLGKKRNLKIISGIDGQVTNSGSQHFTEGEKSYTNNKFIQMTSTTTESKIFFVLSTVHHFSAKQVDSRIEMSRRRIYNRYCFDLAKNEEVVIEKLSSIYTSIDKELESKTKDDVQKLALAELNEIETAGFEKLLKESTKAWEEKVWQILPVTIESNDKKDQLALNFAKYHLHIMTPAHDERMNIGAKGLSGEGYKGHTFWDTEIFLLPYFTFTHPEIAKSLVSYRYWGLEGAHKKALDNGFVGAQYPWEAAWPTSGETTPIWGEANIVTGESTKIWSGFIELHITSDVAYGIKQYLDVTGDQKFAETKGYEVILDTAKFWASRLEWNSRENRYEITDVIGPDEYKEHIDNNAFTNYTAHWNISLALRICANLKKNYLDVFKELDKKMNLAEIYPQWQEKVRKIYLPKANEAQIIPQDDTYLSKKSIDLVKYKQSSQVGTIFHDYTIEQISEMQVSKQADLLLLLFLFEDHFSKEEKLKNWDYYEPKTLHDSSLSLSTHAILAADLGKKELSYSLFERAIDIDMGENMKSSDSGIHAASLGGIWEMTVLGYGGIRVINEGLRIDPHLPEAWTKLSFGIKWRGIDLNIEVSKTKLAVRPAEKVPHLTFTSFGKEYTLDHNILIEL